MKKKTYTLCLDVNITYDENPWKNRTRIANGVELLLAQAIDGKVEVTIAEMQRGISVVPEEPKDNKGILSQ
jgi:hypothetical protein